MSGRRLLLLLLAPTLADALALTHGNLPSTAATAAEVCADALRAGALVASPSPSGERVSVLVDEEACGGLLADMADSEPLWEPDDWDTREEIITFEPLCVNSALNVRPLGAHTASSNTLAEPTLPTVQLLEHPHAFLTTAAGKLHASTLNVLELLVAHASELASADAILDMGCGSGVLSLAALALGHSSKDGKKRTNRTLLRAYGVDVHEPALGAARRNALLNGCGSHAFFGYSYELPSQLAADVTLCNMMPGPLVSVAPDLVSRTRPGGTLLLSGFREADVPAVRAALEPHFVMADAPAVERLGRADEAGGKWIAYACERADTSYDLEALSESAV